MTEIIGVRFKNAGKIYYFDPDGITVEKGGEVIVETARGVEFGVVEMENKSVNDNEVVQPLKKVLRAATEEDRAQNTANRTREKDAIGICEEKIAKHKLDMKLIDVELTFDQNKIIFYFTADGRVDFRELVKELAGVFRMRIELRQIGVRDEAKLMNGIGICGRTLCCATFLDEFHPVSIKMAKEQNLSLNPTKISGICGRLMCCLKYEEDTYEYLNRNLPNQGQTVRTPDGPGEVLSVSVLRQLVRVAVRKKPQDAPAIGSYSIAEINEAAQRHEQRLQSGEPEEETLTADAPAEPRERRPRSHDRSDRNDRGDRGDRNDRGDKSERGDKSDRNGRNRTGERTERRDHSDKPERREHNDRPERRERSERREHGNTDRPERREHGNADKPERRDRPERTDRPKGDRPHNDRPRPERKPEPRPEAAAQVDMPQEDGAGAPSEAPRRRSRHRTFRGNGRKPSGN